MWDTSSIPGSGRYPGEGHGNPLQYSCLDNPIDRGAWRTTVHGVARSQTWLKRLSTHAQQSMDWWTKARCCCCCCEVASVVSNSVWPHRRQPTRLPRPWDSPGKNTGAGCHFLLQCMKVKSLSHVRLFATPWTAAYPAPPSMGFSRQEYWNELPLPSLCMNKYLLCLCCHLAEK